MAKEIICIRQKFNFNSIEPTDKFSVDELCYMFVSAGYERSTDWGRDIFYRKSSVANLYYVIFLFHEDGKSCYYLALIGMDNNSEEVEIFLKLFVRGRTIEKTESRLMALYSSKEYFFNEIPLEFSDQLEDCYIEKYKDNRVS